MPFLILHHFFVLYPDKAMQILSSPTMANDCVAVDIPKRQSLLGSSIDRSRFSIACNHEMILAGFPSDSLFFQKDVIGRKNAIIPQPHHIKRGIASQRVVGNLRSIG